MKLLLVILVVLLGIILISVIGGIIYLLSRGRYLRRLYHDAFEWHLPNIEQGYDGCSFTSTCRICGKEIMQDSQGNWF